MIKRRAFYAISDYRRTRTASVTHRKPTRFTFHGPFDDCTILTRILGERHRRGIARERARGELLALQAKDVYGFGFVGNRCLFLSSLFSPTQAVSCSRKERYLHANKVGQGMETRTAMVIDLLVV